MKTSELIDAALDWAVAYCEGVIGADGRYTDEYCDSLRHDQDGGFSTDWAQGGVIIEREGIEICPVGNGEWRAQLFGQGDLHRQYGDTPLVAAMRCYVASKMGDVVELPKELMEALK